MQVSTTENRVLLRDSLTKDKAETIALQALGFLATQPEELERFLRSSGLALEELREKASEPDLLRAILEFVLADDTRVTGLCQELEIEPCDLHAANHILGRL